MMAGTTIVRRRPDVVASSASSDPSLRGLPEASG